MVSLAFNVPDVNPLTTVNGDRKWPIVLAELLIVKFDVLCISGELASWQPAELGYTVE